MKSEQATMVYEWVKQHPTGTMSECCEALNLNLGIITGMWSTKIAALIIKDWRGEHPDGTLQEFYNSHRYHRNTVVRYWDAAGQTRVIPNNAKAIAEWMDAHPYSTQTECAAALNISVGKVRYYYRMVTDGSVSPAGKRIAEWRILHPFGKQTECARELGISKQAVGQAWHQSDGKVGRPARDVCVFKTRGELFEAVRRWKEENPLGTCKICAQELGVPSHLMAEWFRHMPTRIKRGDERLFPDIKLNKTEDS